MPVGPTHISELRPDGAIERSVLTPEDVGLPRAHFEDFASSRDVKRDAMAILRVILGKDEGSRSEIICLNAAPVLYVIGKVNTLKDGIAMAREAIRSGDAEKKLRAWVTWQNARPEDGLPVLDRMIAQAS
jgi:anthranilate phosphoribosyltransferase